MFLSSLLCGSVRGRGGAAQLSCLRWDAAHSWLEAQPWSGSSDLQISLSAFLVVSVEGVAFASMALADLCVPCSSSIETHCTYSKRCLSGANRAANIFAPGSCACGLCFLAAVHLT